MTDTPLQAFDLAGTPILPGCRLAYLVSPWSSATQRMAIGTVLDVIYAPHRKVRTIELIVEHEIFPIYLNHYGTVPNGYKTTSRIYNYQDTLVLK